LLYALKKMSLIQKTRVLRILRKPSKTNNEIELVQKLVQNYKGMETTEMVININYTKAISIISNFKNGKYKDSVLSLLNFLTQREK